MRVNASIVRSVVLPILLGLALGVAQTAPASASPEAGAAAGTAAPTLVLPFRSVGVSDTTVAVARDLLAGDIEAGGIPVTARPAWGGGIPAAAEVCDEDACARKAAEEAGAAQVVYGTMSKLGEKVVVRAHLLRLADAMPFYTEQISATSVEDLDVVMRRIAEGIIAGRPNSDRASIDTVTREETKRPRRREGRSGIGFRAGMLWPSADSYGGANRLTDLHLAWGFEGRNFMVETTTLMGLRWGDGSVDWTLLDLFVARMFGLGDVSTYAGGGLGVHALHIDRGGNGYYTSPQYGDSYSYSDGSDSGTALTAEVGVGVVLLRTYSFRIIADARYHYTFEDFPDAGGDGANGLLVTFGTSY